MTDGAAIDKFLKNRKSPLAGYGKVFVAAGKKYGVDPRLVVAISGIESSFGKHILGTHNAWGWGPGKGFGSWEEGITTVTRGLRSGYLDRGLKTPEQIVNRYAPASDGNDTGNWVRVVNQFLGELGAPKRGLAATRPISPVPTTTPRSVMQLPPFDPSPYTQQIALGNLLDISRTGKVSGEAMLQRTAQGLASLSQARRQYEDILAGMQVTDPQVYADPEAKRGTAPAPPSSFKGKVYATPMTWKGTHITDNLDWNHGQKTARDIIMPAGTPVGAPMSGTIIAHGSAQGGQSLTFRADDGTEFWLGHIEGALPVGTRVQKGAPIATISPHHETPHLHIDRKW